mgnify:CR=1 FL=1
MSKLGAYHAALAVNKGGADVLREEFLDYMTFRRNDRPLFDEIWGPLVGLKEEWAAQGARPEELDLSAFRYRRATFAGVRASAGWVGGGEERILEETAEHIIALDRMGRRVKLCKGAATIALPLDYPVRDMDDWRRVKAHYEFREDRLATGWEKAALEARASGAVLALRVPGGFDEPRQLLGEERLCLAFHEQPELVQEILRTLGDTAFRVLERVTARVPVDMLDVHEDMAGKSGPLAGPRQVAEFIGPYYRRLWDLARERGARLFRQDSDGNMNAVIPAFLDAGVNVMYPMEPAAGMDIVKARESYGTRLAFMGGIDKHVLRRSRREIASELAYKIPPMLRTGGCVLGLDHRIPNGTPIAHYRYYIREAWRLMDSAAAV